MELHHLGQGQVKIKGESCCSANTETRAKIISFVVFPPQRRGLRGGYFQHWHNIPLLYAELFKNLEFMRRAVSLRGRQLCRGN